MRVSDALDRLRALEDASFARRFLSCLLDVDVSYLLLHLDERIDKASFDIAYERYASGMPLEYVLGKASFYGIDLLVDERVLIPRFDSEILLDRVIELVNTRPISRVLEIGFGSGALSIVLSMHTSASIHACDISADAYDVATANARMHGSNVEFFVSDFASLDLSSYDLVFSNPPYIARDYPLDARVLREPHVALFGGDRGDEILSSIVSACARYGVEYLACEIGYDQRESMSAWLAKYGYAASFYTDHGGFDRAFVAQKLA